MRGGPTYPGERSREQMKLRPNGSTTLETSPTVHLQGVLLNSRLQYEVDKGVIAPHGITPIYNTTWRVEDLGELIKTRVAMWIKVKFDIKVHLVKDFKGYLDGMRKEKV
ncbi:hypothetical protein RHMOL_Rhmol08G0239300 [Rhododendron molle]|uniref:Uncharacterized protein n=1 Tax=Rhododendron molle TaxID=49168 RepID=A0ACC0MTR2_RHOML|nr:hypothetical protein RHMOL_Rhmol08G0239300 [Rhododendron molle]